MGIQIHQLKNSKHPLKNYCYIIVDEITRKAMIVDPSGTIQEIEQKLIEYDALLSTILTTHSHFDHVYLINILTKKYNPTEVLMSKIEIDYYGFHCDNLVAIKEFTPFTFGNNHVVPILTPGHTKGSLCYLIEGNLFTGDTLFIEGCGISWGKGADPNAMFDSMQLLKRHIPLHTKVYPSHSYGEEPGQTFAYLLKNNIYLQIDSRDHFVAFRMRENQNGILESR